MDSPAYLRQLRALLPPGRLFSEVGGKFLSLLEAAADEFALVEEYFAAALAEANPLTATQTLEEWEAEYGLESTGTTLERQRRIAARRAVRRRTRPADYRERMATLLGLEPWQVLVLETSAAQAVLMADPREIYRFYIYRDPTISGTYSVDDAQVFLDEFSQSHVKGHVIESVDFLCDDAYSLCDRDLIEAAGLSPSFSPLNISGLKLYLNADSGVSNPSGVSQWDDLSGQGNHVTQATVGNRPSLVTAYRNGKNAIQFGAGKSIWRTAFTGGILAQPTTIMVVGDFPDEAALGAAIDSRDLGNRQVLFDAGNHTNYTQYATASGTAVRAGTGPGFKLATYNGTSSVLRQVHHGFAATDTATPTIGSGSMGGVTVGAQANDTGPMTGKIFAVMIYDKVLTPTESTNLQNWAKSYYAITPL